MRGEAIRDNGPLVQASAIPGWLRAVIGGDGTTTSAVEAYAGEPLVPDLRLHRDATPAEVMGTPMASAAGRVMVRAARLVGARTGQTWIFGHTILAYDALPPAPRDDLLVGIKPIGTVLAEHRIESFREILHVTVSRPPAHLFGAACELPGRTLAIHIGQRLAMLVTEWFASPQ